MTLLTITNNMKKIVGKVAEDEKNSIRTLYNHKNSLEELILVLKDDDEVYKKVLSDLNDTKQKYQEWWDTMSQKYQWEKTKNGRWQINFDTCEIYLIDND